MSPLPLIIDCDPGVDDAVALFLAFAAPDTLQVLAVTTAGGNVDAALTARNARLIRQLAGREDVPVYLGAAAPLVREPVGAGHFHGESGLGDLEVFEPAAPVGAGHAAQAIVDIVMSRPPGAVAMAVTGPMTNLALALRLEPGLAARLGPVAAMGGARSAGGNITASAEFNIFADPHAADVVLRSGVKITLIGLDATYQVRATPGRIAAVRALDTPVAQTVARLFDFSALIYASRAGADAPPVHDPCTIAYLLKPELFEIVPAIVRVETDSALTLGHTAVEFRLPGPDSANAGWATKADGEGVFALLLERLGGR